jgi:hypothetical protein
MAAKKIVLETYLAEDPISRHLVYFFQYCGVFFLLCGQMCNCYKRSKLQCNAY